MCEVPLHRIPEIPVLAYLRRLLGQARADEQERVRQVLVCEVPLYLDAGAPRS